jgi:glycosyltransferase involved in cell wall biosynthesis
MRKFYKKFKFLFIRSEVYRDIVKKELNFEQNRIFTIPAGVDIKRFNHVEPNREVWSRYGVAKESKKALFVGRVTREKNIPFLLDVWKENYKNDKNSHLILVGVGEFFYKKEEYRAFNILFLGHKEGIELEELYKNSDFFIFPSNSDTLGQVVIEAMACGICSIIGDEGGAKTIIEDKFTGVILEKNNKEKWVEAIKLLIENNELRNYYNKNALLNSKNFDIQKSFQYFFEKIEQ